MIDFENLHDFFIGYDISITFEVNVQSNNF